MPNPIPFRVIIDTNVVFEGVTKQGGACGLIVDAWSAGLFRPFVSNALAYEYADVLSRLLSAERWQKIQPNFSIKLNLSWFILLGGQVHLIRETNTLLIVL
jgi:predicted nucleic acid-binding protein